MYVISSTGIISTDYGNAIIDHININIADTNIYPGNIARRNWFLGMQSNNVSFGRNFQYGSVSFPWQLGYRSFADPDSGIVSNIYNSYTVAGNSFSNVVEWDDGSDGVFNYPYFHDIIHLNASAYIIKMRLNHPIDSINIVWELQRWHIVK